MSANNDHSLPKIPELESLRGLAALCVVYYHLPRWTTGMASPLTHNFYLMVDLFFVLSGFVIYRTYQARIRSGADFLRFALLRLGRLYPLHLTFLLLMLLIETLKLLAASYGLPSINIPPFSQSNLATFSAHLLLLQSITGTNPQAFNGPSWSISAEIFSYGLFGLIVWWIPRIRIPVMICLAATALLILLHAPPGSLSPLSRCFSGFFIGCLTAAAITDQPRWRLPDLAWLPLLAIVALLAAMPAKTYGPLISPLTALLIATIILGPDGSLRRILRHPALTGLGTLSYSIYMSHISVIWIINQMIRLNFHPPEQIINGISHPTLSAGATALACLTVYAVTLAVSAFSYRWIEAPCRLAVRKAVARTGRRPETEDRP